MVVYINWKTKV